MQKRAIIFLSSAFLVVACSGERKGGGAIPKRDSGVVDTGVVDTGVPGNPDTGVPVDPDGGTPPPDTGVPPDSGMPPDGGTPPDGGNPPFDGGALVGDPFNAAARAPEYAQAACAFRTRCESILYQYLGSDEQTCRTETSRAVLDVWSSYEDAIAGGRAAFSLPAFNRCLTAFNNADCTTGLPVTACEDLFTGNRPEGIACGSSVECSTGTWCALEQLGGCGTCLRRAAPTESCAQTICDVGSDCFDVDGMGTLLCVRVDLALNATCGTVDTGLCTGRLQCVGNAGARTCRNPAGLNQTCDATGMGTTPTCNIYAGHICNPANTTCANVGISGVGEMCGGINICDVNGGCSQATMTCTAWPGNGQQCPNDTCATGLYCDAASTTCRAVTPEGQSCTTSAQCGERFCSGGVCGPITWQACN